MIGDWYLRKIEKQPNEVQTIDNRSRYRADTFLNHCNPRLKGKNLLHQDTLHFRVLVRAAISDNNGAVVHVRRMA